MPFFCDTDVSFLTILLPKFLIDLWSSSLAPRQSWIKIHFALAARSVPVCLSCSGVCLPSSSHLDRRLSNYHTPWLRLRPSQLGHPSLALLSLLRPFLMLLPPEVAKGMTVGIRVGSPWVLFHFLPVIGQTHLVGRKSGG